MTCYQRYAPLTLATLVSVQLLATGCGGREETRAAAIALRDSAGIVIVDNGALDRDIDLLVSPEPAVGIGVVDGAEEYQFFQVSDITRLSDGAIVVANGGSRDVRFFEADGTHRISVGRPGQGPEEFRYPTGVSVQPGDTILVQDRMDRVRFAPDGSFVARITTNREQLQALFAEGRGSEGGSWLPDGTLFVPIYTRTQGRPTAGAPFRPPMTLARVGRKLESLDTLGQYGGIGQQYVEVGGQRGVMTTVPPFSTNTSWSVGATDGTIAVGDNASPELHLFDMRGRMRIVRWHQESQPITSGEVETWKDEQRASSWTRGQLPDLERSWAKMDIPEKKAYYGMLTLGQDGHVWVAASSDYGADPATFLVFGPQGRYEGTVTVPGRFRPFDAAAEWMVGVYYDDTEVEFVRLYSLTHRPH